MFNGESFLVTLIVMGLLLPPIITVGVAAVIKTIALFSQKNIGWGLSMLMGFLVYLAVLAVSVAVG